MHKDILLSICIPTYNRAEYLRKTLSSITGQEGFDDRVEIVISDNCSTDHTSDVVMDFKKKHANIFYYCNETNITDKNFVRALSLGNGLFLKLLNDTALFGRQSLLEILNVIQENKTEKPVLYFANGTSKSAAGRSIFYDLNSFLSEASFYVTWIVTFGMWKSYFDTINDKYEGIELNLNQTILLFNNVLERKMAVVISRELFSVEAVKNKGGYNLVTVFVGNYVGKILFSYYKKNNISGIIYRNEKNRLLKDFLYPWLYRLRKSDSEYRLLSKGSAGLLFKYYGLNPEFYFYMIKLNIKLFVS